MNESAAERWNEALRNSAAAASLQVGLLAVGASPWEVLAVGAQPFVAESVGALKRRLDGHRESAGSRCIEAAGKQLGCGPEEVLRRADTPELVLLSVAALEAATRTANQEKIAALGRLLAEGLEANDDTQLDETWLVVKALGDLEEPHLRVLAYLNQRVDSRISGGWDLAVWDAPKCTVVQLSDELSALRRGMTAFVAALQRHGLIELVPMDVGREIDRVRRTNSFSSALRQDLAGIRVKETWQISPLGHHLLTYLTDRANDDPAENGPGSESTPN